MTSTLFIDHDCYYTAHQNNQNAVHTLSLDTLKQSPAGHEYMARKYRWIIGNILPKTPQEKILWKQRHAHYILRERELSQSIREYYPACIGIPCLIFSLILWALLPSTYPLYYFSAFILFLIYLASQQLRDRFSTLDNILVFSRPNGTLLIQRNTWNTPLLTRFDEWKQRTIHHPHKYRKNQYSFELYHPQLKLRIRMVHHDSCIEAYVHQMHLNHFMDIQKPLPDIPRYETCRHRDPITAFFDQHTQRDPNYWRRQSPTRIKKKIIALRKKIKKIF